MGYNISIIGLNHKTAPLEMIEAIGVSPSKLSDALGKLKKLYPLNEYVIISTCNRVEVYIGGAREISFDNVISFIAGYNDFSREDILPFIYVYQNEEAIKHLFEVAAGLDSLVIGETQVLGQIKKGYQKALDEGFTGRVLNKAFQKAFKIAKKVRTLTGIGEGNVSISSVACQLADEVLGGLSQKKVLLVGVGKVGTLTLKFLRGKGADTVLVSSRRYERAEDLAREFNGKAVRLDEIQNFMVYVDIVISSTAAPHYILHPDMMPEVLAKRNNKPVFLIDLAVPRDIDPVIGEMENVYLYNINSLRRLAAGNISQRENEVLKCGKIISMEIRNFVEQEFYFTLRQNDTLLETVTA